MEQGDSRQFVRLQTATQANPPKLVWQSLKLSEPSRVCHGQICLSLGDTAAVLTDSHAPSPSLPIKSQTNLSWRNLDKLFRSGCGSEHAPFNGRLCIELAVCECDFLDFYTLDQNENNCEYASICVLAITIVNMSKIHLFNWANKILPTLYLTEFNNSTDTTLIQITSFYI